MQMRMHPQGMFDDVGGERDDSFEQYGHRQRQLLFVDFLFGVPNPVRQLDTTEEKHQFT